MNKESLFKTEYNKANMINVKSDLDIYDECNFSLLDILKEKEVEVLCKQYKDCKCVSSVNFSTYYSRCEKCDGKGKLVLSGNEVLCNHCNGIGRVTKEKCPLCEGEGKVIKKSKVFIKLNKTLKEEDVITVKGKGKIGEDVAGDLFIKVKIEDKDCFEIKNNDVYDKRMIDFSKEELNKGVSKQIETVKGFVSVKSKGEQEKEVVRLVEEGIENGDYYVCLSNELTPLKGEDVYKNVIISEDNLGFYIDKNELISEKRCLTVNYYKKLNELNYEYIDLKEANNFKIVKLKGKGLKGKNGGVNGDLYLRIYFDDEFGVMGDVLHHKGIKLNRYEVSDGKKVVEFNKEKVTLNFPKNISDEYESSVKDLGFIVGKNEFEDAKFIVNPSDNEVYKVSVRVNKRDKVIYIKDYKKYFYEEVKINYNEGLKITLSKKDNCIVVRDVEGNKVIVKVIR